MGLKDYLKTNYQRAFLVLFLITLTQATTTFYTYLTSPELNAISQRKSTVIRIWINSATNKGRFYKKIALDSPTANTDCKKWVH